MASEAAAELLAAVEENSGTLLEPRVQTSVPDGDTGKRSVIVTAVGNTTDDARRKSLPIRNQRAFSVCNPKFGLHFFFVIRLPYLT